MFSPTLLSPFINITLLLLLLPLLLLLHVLLAITVIIISTELLALYDRCLGWGWVWWVGLIAGLQVGQAFGVLLLPGFGISSSSPRLDFRRSLVSGPPSPKRDGWTREQQTMSVM